jgi:hypothetical protein
MAARPDVPADVSGMPGTMADGRAAMRLMYTVRRPTVRLVHRSGHGDDQVALVGFRVTEAPRARPSLVPERREDGPHSHDHGQVDQQVRRQRRSPPPDSQHPQSRTPSRLKTIPSPGPRHQREGSSSETTRILPVEWRRPRSAGRLRLVGWVRYVGRPPGCQLWTSMSAYRPGVSNPRAWSGSGAWTSAPVPSQAVSSSDSSGP